MKKIALLAAVPFLLVCTTRTTAEAPVAGFGASPVTGTAPLNVQFADESTNDPISWDWDFGDGTSSTDQSPAHAYDTAAAYDVSLIVSNEAGADTLTEESYITVTSDTGILAANFTGDPTSGEVPLEVTFTDQSTGDPTTWSWDFGDNNTSPEQNPIHTYDTEGAYDVRLVVSDGENTDTLVREAYITVEGLVYKEVKQNNITFKWRTDGEGKLHGIVSAPTRGWVSVGFDATSMHLNANIIIGYVSGGTVYIQDNYGITQITHVSDVSRGGVDDVTNPAGTEIDDVTEISFTIPLDSGDPNDRPLVVGQTYRIILAYGPNFADDYTSKHLGAAIVDIEI